MADNWWPVTKRYKLAIEEYYAAAKEMKFWAQKVPLRLDAYKIIDSALESDEQESEDK